MAYTGWGTGNHWRYASGIITAVPLSIAAWVYTPTTVAEQTIAGLFTSGSAFNRNNFRLKMNAGGAINASAASSSGSNGGTTSTTIGTGSWNHAAGVWTSSTSRDAFLNGGGKGSNTTGQIPSGIDRTSIGTGDGSTSTNPWDASGYIAEVAYWDVALSDAEILVLSTGISPLLVRPASLVAYYPLWGNSSPEINFLDRAAVLTMQGTVTKAAHPRIIMPRRPDGLIIPPAAAGILYPQLERGIRGLNRGVALGSYH